MVNSLAPRHTMYAAPASELDPIFNRFDRLIRGDSPWPTWDGALLAWPPMDLCETDEAYLLEMDLPGVQSDDIQIELTGDELLITGQRTQPESSSKCYLRVERGFGPFQRRIRLTSPVERDRIEAHYQDGILSVTVPKAECAKARRIPVSSKA